MADNLIQQALSRGYSIDEIANKLSEDAGFAPDEIRSRGYSSQEIIGKLGYEMPVQKESMLDKAQTALGWNTGRDVTVPDSITRDASEEIEEPKQKRNILMENSLMRGQDGMTSDPASDAIKSLPSVQKVSKPALQFERQKESNRKWLDNSKPLVVDQLMRDNNLSADDAELEFTRMRNAGVVPKATETGLREATWGEAFDAGIAKVKPSFDKSMAGLAAMKADMTGDFELANAADALRKEANDQLAAAEGVLAGTSKDSWKKTISDAPASLAQNLPTVIAASALASNPALAAVIGNIGLAGMGLMSGGASYSEGKDAGLNASNNLQQSALKAMAEVIPEKMSLSVLTNALGKKAAEQAMKESILQSAKTLGKYIGSEIGTEELTTIAQFGVDKMYSKPGMPMKELVSQMIDTAKATLIQAPILGWAGILSKAAVDNAGRIIDPVGYQLRGFEDAVDRTNFVPLQGGAESFDGYEQRMAEVAANPFGPRLTRIAKAEQTKAAAQQAIATAPTVDAAVDAFNVATAAGSSSMVDQSQLLNDVNEATNASIAEPLAEETTQANDAQVGAEQAAAPLLTVPKQPTTTKPLEQTPVAMPIPKELAARVAAKSDAALSLMAKTNSDPVVQEAVKQEQAKRSGEQSHIERQQNSWVIRNKETGEVVMETTDPAKVAALNTEKYEAVTAYQHLVEYNQAVKASGGVEPNNQPKPKKDRKAVYPESDSALVAIAKLGGMDTQQLLTNGFDQSDISVQKGARVSKKTGQLGKAPFRAKQVGFNMPIHRNGGMSFDGMREALVQYGYLPEDASVNDAIELLRRELRGEPVYTASAVQAQAEAAEADRQAMMEAEQEANEASGYDELQGTAEERAADALIEELYGEEVAALARGMRVAGLTEEEINAEIEAFNQRTGAQDGAGQSQERSGEGRAEESGTDAEVFGGKESAEPDWLKDDFGLEGQTNEEAAAEYKQQQAEANKQEAEQPAKNVTVDQVDIFNEQGGLRFSKAAQQFDEGKLTKATFEEGDNRFETGVPVTFKYLHNKQSATKLFGIPDKDSPYDRGYEPSGKYVTITDGERFASDNPKQFESGILTFENPLVLSDKNWKRELSAAFGGLTGKRLSQAVIAAGYDGVVTIGKYGTSETLDLTSFDARKAKYSKLSDAPTGEELIVIHNLSAGNLLYADDIGGIPVPSIGITKASSPFTGFGEITLIASSDMIDPERGVPVFDRDAYTARFPSMNYKKVPSKKADAFYERMKPVLQYGEDGKSFMQQLWDAMTGSSASPDKVSEEFQRYLEPRMMYAKEVLGKEIRVPMKLIEPVHPFTFQKTWIDFVKANKKDYNDDDFNRRAGLAAKKAMSEYVESKMTDDVADNERLRKAFARYIDRYIGEDGSMNWNVLDKAYEQAGLKGKKRIDTFELSQRVDKVVGRNDPAYLKWITAQIDGLFNPPTITLRGREVEPTLDNIVEAMTTGGVQGAEKTMAFGGGKTAAMLGKRFKSIAEIKAARDQVVSSERHDEMKKSAEKTVEAYRLKAVEFFTQKDWRGNIDTWAGMDSAMEALAKAGKMSLTDGQIKAALSSKGFRGVSDEVVNLARESIVAIRSAATDYFEAKPQRAVRLKEFKGAVVPKGTDPDVIAALERRGLQVVEYNSNKPEDRAAKVGKLAKTLNKANKNVLFSSSGKPIESEALPQQTAERLIARELGSTTLAKVLVDSGIVSFVNRGSKFQGATFENGNVVLNLDALTEQNFAGVFKHEGFHSTVRELVGEETWNQLMSQLEQNLKLAKGNDWVTRANAAIPADTKAEDRTEELAAYSIEQVTNGAKVPNFIKRWVESILSAIRTALIRGMGGEKAKLWAMKNLKPQDLANLAIAGLKAKARNELASQGRAAMAYSTAFGPESQHRTALGDVTEIEVDGVMRPALNSNGKPIHWSREGVENFWRWFGDSRVVDDQGRPLVVYHGTGQDFEKNGVVEFDPLKVGTATDDGWFGKGFYFAPTAQDANQYAAGQSPNVMQLYIRIKNPFDWRKEIGMGMRLGTQDERYGITRDIVGKGHDGVFVFDETIKLGENESLSDAQWLKVIKHYQEKGGFTPSRSMVETALRSRGYSKGDFISYYGQDLADAMPTIRTLKEIVTLRPEQAKSATGNRGTFDGENPDIRFSFAGKSAATADKHALTTAQDRLGAGEDAETVRKETGWFKGADGKWRYEIDDSGATLKKPYPENGARWGDVWKSQVGKGEYSTVGSMLDHPALFSAYPQLADIPVSTKKGAGASYSVESRQIDIGEDVPMYEVVSTLLHEIQHGIQTIEGFASGGNTKNFDYVENSPEYKKWNALRLALPMNPSSKQVSEMMDLYDKIPSKFEAYRRLAGEVESRNVQYRQNMTAEQRREQSPESTQDVTNSDVIVVFNGREMANAPVPANSQTHRTPLPEETKAQAAQRKIQDKFNRFTVIKDFLKEQGVTLSEQADVYKAEERMHSRFANKVEDFRTKLVEPLIKKIQAAGFSMDDVSLFLHAQHAEERNNQIAKINPKVTDGSGMSTSDANKVLAAAPAELKVLANEFRQITEMTKQTLLDAGIISQDMVNAWEGAYSNYVPLKGGPDEKKSGTGKGLHVNGKMKRALGHGKRKGGEWIAENILADYERAVMLAEKNRVGHHLVRMALEAGRDDLITLNKPEKRAVLRNDHAYEVRKNGAVIGVFNTQDAARMFKTMNGGTGITITKTNDPSVIYSASPMLQDNEANVYVNGHAIRVQINDELLARAYKNLGAEPLNAIFSAGRMLNGYLSKAYTGYNPEFILTNIVRDFTTGLINVTGEEGALFAAKAAKNYVSSFGSLLKYAVIGKETQWIKDYRDDGGNTGAAYLSDLERLGKEIKTEYDSYKGVIENLKARDGAGAARAAGRNLFNVSLKWIEHLNQAGENAMRLSIYRAAIESGKTRAEAASLAKNSTVNFNRKGELGANINALYLFFNAGVQGTSALAHAHFKGKHKYQAWALSSGMIGLGFLAAAAFGGGDEDDYDRELSDYDKSRNLVIRAGDSWVKIPVPYGYGFFYNLGRHLADAERKGEWNKMPWHLASDFVGEFTPFGGIVAGKEPDVRQLVYATPTAFQIPGALAVNRTGMGSPIFPENKFDENQPDNLKMWRNTKGTLADDLAQVLDKAGLQVSPETLKYLGRTATGGSGAFVGSVFDAGKLTLEGADLETKEMPFVRKFVKEGSVSDYRSAFYEAKSEASKAADDFARAKKMGDMMSAKRLEKDNAELIAMDKYADSLSKMIKAKRDMQDVVKQDEKLTVAEKRLKLKALELEEQKVYDRYLDIFKKRTKERRERLQNAF